MFSSLSPFSLDSAAATGTTLAAAAGAGTEADCAGTAAVAPSKTPLSCETETSDEVDSCPSICHVRKRENKNQFQNMSKTRNWTNLALKYTK